MPPNYVGAQEAFAQLGQRVILAPEKVGSRGDLANPILFANEAMAYDFMYAESFSPNGSVFKEVKAYLTTQGVLVLPTTLNTGSSSTGQHWEDQQNGRWLYKYRGKYLKILGDVHTHPNGWHASLTVPDDFN